MSLIDPISYRPNKTHQGTRDEALDFYSNPKNQKAHATLYRPAEWLAVSLTLCFIWGSSEYVGTTFSFKPIFNPYSPMPTYSKILQSLLVDRSIAQDLKDRCGAKMPLACFGFLVDRDGKRSLLQFRNMYRNYRTFISNHPILIFRTMQVRERHQNNNTVDGRNPAITAWDALNLENSGINYQPPLVNAGFLPLCHFPFSNQPDVFFPSKKSTTFWPKKVEEAAFTSDQLTLIRFALDQKAMMQLGHLAQGLRQMVDFSV